MRRLSLLGIALVCVGMLAAEPPADDKDKKAPPEKPPVEKAPADKAHLEKPPLEKPPSEKDKTAPLAAGNDLPGAFHPFNVNGPRKGNFSCLVSANGLNTGVMLFVRDLEATDAFKDLLTKLENAIVKNPNVRLAVHVVFVPDDLKDVVNDDDKREELVTKIEDIAKGTMLQNVVLALASKADVEAYGLNENAVYTLVAYHKYQIRASEALEKDKLTAEKVQAIMAVLAEKIGLTRK